MKTTKQNDLSKLYSMKKELKLKLLSCGGLMVSPQPDPFSGLVFNYGELFPDFKIKLKLMEQCMCHENSIKLARKNPTRYIHFYGYGLSADDMWRPHSWIFDDQKKEIIETTEKRLKYFGIVTGELFKGIVPD